MKKIIKKIPGLPATSASRRNKLQVRGGQALRQSSGQAFRQGSGQAMLMTVLIMFGIILSATTIGGYLMLNQLRQATNAANSIRALAAADAGIECQLYNLIAKPVSTRECDTSTPEKPDGQTFTSDVPITVNTAVTTTGDTTVIQSTGGAAKTYRAFEVTIVTTPPPPPAP